MLVLRTVCSDRFNLSIVFPNGEGKSDDAITVTDQFQIVLRNSGFRGSPIEKELNVFKETRFCFHVANLSE